MFVLPGEPLVEHGPYRWLRHPNYLAVIAELLGFALIVGARWSGIIAMLCFRGAFAPPHPVGRGRARAQPVGGTASRIPPYQMESAAYTSQSHDRTLNSPGLTVCALLLSSGDLPSAQSRNTPADTAANLLKAGQYDEVDKLLRDEKDPRAIAIRARAYIARGRYDDAEKLLTPAAAAAPTSDAALELGLLQIYLGRRDQAARGLNRLVDTLQPKTAMDLLRQAEAARALGEFHDANTFFQEADRAQPKDPVINTAWGELFLEKAEKEQAQKSFQMALEVDANNPAALIGMARLVADVDQPAAMQAVERALKVNPNYVPAYLRVLGRSRSTTANGRTRTRRSTRRSKSIPTASRRARWMPPSHSLKTARPSSIRRRKPS